MTDAEPGLAFPRAPSIAGFLDVRVKWRKNGEPSSVLIERKVRKKEKPA
ncbi:MAG: hypothetical protein IMZ69_01870 [Spirochaetes bacterium]|nr:hypothetical protein [Spirochaetota bacterium]